jgi:hypothetical protein
MVRPLSARVVRKAAPGSTPRRRSAPLDVLVETIGPPISEVAWSPEVVAQTLEILPVGLRDGRLFWLKPMHADSLRVGLPKARQPGDFVLEVMEWYPLSPRVVHSTSWRYGDGAVVLTYVAVVEPPERLPPDSLVELPLGRSELARGEAMAPPKGIQVQAVLEHALRHLSWLVRDDPAIASALEDWKEMLQAYTPETFRALG